MQTITVQEAQSRLAEIIDQLAPEEEIVLVRNSQPVARLVSMVVSAKPQPLPGRCAGMLTVVTEDEEHLQDWAEYMP